MGSVDGFLTYPKPPASAQTSGDGQCREGDNDDHFQAWGRRWVVINNSYYFYNVTRIVQILHLLFFTESIILMWCGLDRRWCECARLNQIPSHSDGFGTRLVNVRRRPIIEPGITQSRIRTCHATWPSPAWSRKLHKHFLARFLGRGKDRTTCWCR